MKKLNKSLPYLMVILTITLYGKFSFAQPIEVWPGDANNDGIVNHLDLLNVGRGFGKQGYARDSASILWQQQFVFGWNDTLPDGLNLGYSDCSGNGIVNIEDFAGIENNYGLVNSNFTGLNYLQGSSGNPQLEINTNGSTWLQGDTVSVTIILNQSTDDSIYGVAFTFDYDTSLVKQSSVTAMPHPQFGGGGRQPVHVQMNYPDSGYIEFAVSRTNNKNAGGTIAVGIISFVIEDNIIGKSFLDVANALNIQKIKMLNYTMQEIPARGDTANTKISTVVLEKHLASQFSIYPIPASDRLFIDNHGKHKVEQIELFDIKGMTMTKWSGETAQIIMLNVSSLKPGIYLMRITTDKGLLQRKILIK
ncbi:MAG: T9SS type A sorting domain-containing protein [Chitinophagales bacterium]